MLAGLNRYLFFLTQLQAAHLRKSNPKGERIGMTQKSLEKVRHAPALRRVQTTCTRMQTKTTEKKQRLVTV